MMNLKKTFLGLAAATTLASCNGKFETSQTQSKKETYETLSKGKKDQDSLTNHNDNINTGEYLQEDRTVLKLTQEQFGELINFIEKNGFVIPEDGVPCDYQYTFFDSAGNRHGLITKKRDKNDQPSLGGNIDQITIYAYKNGIKDQDHFFGYVIHKDRVEMMHNDTLQEEKDIVTKGVNELLDKINKLG